MSWAGASHLKTDLVAAALTGSLARRRPADCLVFHSDRGCQLRFKESSQHWTFGAIVNVRPGLQQVFSIPGFCAADC